MNCNNRPNRKTAWHELDLFSSELISSEQWADISAAASLSPRECEVIKRLLTGNTRDKIANALQIKPRTVRQHMESIHQKLNVTNRVELVLRIIQIRDTLFERLELCQQCRQAIDADINGDRSRSSEAPNKQHHSPARPSPHSTQSTR